MQEPNRPAPSPTPSQSAGSTPSLAEPAELAGGVPHLVFKTRLLLLMTVLLMVGSVLYLLYARGAL